MKEKEDDKVYRGINNYQQFYERKDTAKANADSSKNRWAMNFFIFKYGNEMMVSELTDSNQ